MSASPPGAEPKQYVVERVRRALAQDERVAELDIHVKVVGTKLFVKGTVATPERCDAISAVLTDVVPDFDVHNEVVVVPVTEDEDEEELS